MPGKDKTSGWRAFRDRAPIHETTMIPAENPRAFEDLHRELYEEFSPVGITEERLVQRLAVLNLERDRLYRYTQFKMEIRQAEINRRVPNAKLLKAIKSRAVEFQTAKFEKEIEKLNSEDVAAEKSKQSPPEKLSDSERRKNDVLEHVASLPDVGPVDSRDIFIKLVEEFPIIERVKELEQIDVAIDRTIKRLMQLKTMKQMFRQLEPKVISTSQNKKSTP
jgi:hypothetical protein